MALPHVVRVEETVLRTYTIPANLWSAGISEKELIQLVLKDEKACAQVDSFRNFTVRVESIEIDWALAYVEEDTPVVRG